MERMTRQQYNSDIRNSMRRGSPKLFLSSQSILALVLGKKKTVTFRLEGRIGIAFLKYANHFYLVKVNNPRHFESPYDRKITPFSAPSEQWHQVPVATGSNNQPPPLPLHLLGSQYWAGPIQLRHTQGLRLTRRFSSFNLLPNIYVQAKICSSSSILSIFQYSAHYRTHPTRSRPDEWRDEGIGFGPNGGVPVLAE